MNLTHTPKLFRITLCGVALALSACGGSSTADSPGTTGIPGTVDSPGTGDSPGTADSPDVDTSPTTPLATAACELISPAQLTEIIGQPYDAGTEGLGIAPETRCEFAGGDTGIDVAITASPGGDGTPNPFQSREGFERIFGPATAVDGLALPAFEHFDDSIIGQQALLATDGHAYLLVTLTGDPVTSASVGQATAIAALALDGPVTP